LGNDEAEADDEEGGSTKKACREEEKKLLDPKTWERDDRLVKVAMKVREVLGDSLSRITTSSATASMPRSRRQTSSSLPPTQTDSQSRELARRNSTTSDRQGSQPW